MLRAADNHSTMSFIEELKRRNLAWVFELTPEGIKREHEVHHTQLVAPQTAKKPNSVIIGLLLAVIAMMTVPSPARKR
jgi:hypothetical protein